MTETGSNQDVLGVVTSLRTATETQLKEDRATLRKVGAQVMRGEDNLRCLVQIEKRIALRADPLFLANLRLMRETKDLTKATPSTTLLVRRGLLEASNWRGGLYKQTQLYREYKAAGDLVDGMLLSWAYCYARHAVECATQAEWGAGEWGAGEWGEKMDAYAQAYARDGLGDPVSALPVLSLMSGLEHWEHPAFDMLRALVAVSGAVAW